MLRHSIRGIVVDQTTAFSPGDMMFDGVNGWCRSDCCRAAVKNMQSSKWRRTNRSWHQVLGPTCPRPAMSRWTDEELRELVTLWPTNSVSQIAKQLHRRRSAILKEGRAAASGWTAAAQSRVFQRKSANAAAAGRNNAVTTSRRLRTGRNTDRR